MTLPCAKGRRSTSGCAPEEHKRVQRLKAERVPAKRDWRTFSLEFFRIYVHDGPRSVHQTSTSLESTITIRPIRAAALAKICLCHQCLARIGGQLGAGYLYLPGASSLITISAAPPTRGVNSRPGPSSSLRRRGGHASGIDTGCHSGRRNARRRWPISLQAILWRPNLPVHFLTAITIPYRYEALT